MTEENEDLRRARHVDKRLLKVSMSSGDAAEKR